MSELDDSMFEASKIQATLTRKQKRENSQRHKEVPTESSSLTDIFMEQLKAFQNTDPTLEKIWQGMTNSCDGQFFKKDGLLYRWWVPPQHSSDDMEIEQPHVLPEQCRQGVLQLAHTIPLAGHLGKDKTAQ